ncbi:DUF4872 domain-containing protein [Streptosporangiaceae bacterium NEAU-GS5]|nr:DUF4872 domain-containing protein [Streptosporangiaceae bacterium NEAU-GS5]
MTDNKAFKRRVRERMARTGESYTTARRHVLAKSGRRPAEQPITVLPGYPAPGGGEHHDSALLGHVLQQAGVAVGEAVVAGLGGGIGFMYAVFEYATVTTTTIVTQHHPEPFIPAALARLAVPYEVKNTGSAAVAEKNLRAAIDRGRAPILRVDRFALPWHPGLPFGDAYEVAVMGLDGATAYVDDECGRPNPIALDALEAAWAAHKKGRHHQITVTGTQAPGYDLAAAARDAIATTAAHLTGPVLGHAFDVNFGLSGMRKLVRDLSDPKNKRLMDPRTFFSTLTRIHHCLEIEYGAPGAMRPLYARFLDEVAPLVDGGLTRAAELYRDAGESWSALASAAVSTHLMARYDELTEQALAVQLTEGAAGADRLAALAAEANGLGEAYAAGPLDEPERRALLDTMAGHAARALALEESAVEILQAVHHAV